jgi:hypothetical protein
MILPSPISAARRRFTCGGASGPNRSVPPGANALYLDEVSIFFELFSPGSGHRTEELRRLENTREEEAQGEPGRGPIDLNSGTVLIRVPSKQPEDSVAEDLVPAQSVAQDAVPDGFAPAGSALEDAVPTGHRAGKDGVVEDRVSEDGAFQDGA